MRFSRLYRIRKIISAPDAGKDHIYTPAIQFKRITHEKHPTIDVRQVNRKKKLIMSTRIKLLR